MTTPARPAGGYPERGIGKRNYDYGEAVTLPLYPGMTGEDADDVVDALWAALDA